MEVDTAGFGQLNSALHHFLFLDFLLLGTSIGEISTTLVPLFAALKVFFCRKSCANWWKLFAPYILEAQSSLGCD